MVKEQQDHWNSVYSKNTSYFGDSPSEFCEMCMPWIRKSGSTRMLELGPGQGRDTCRFVDSGFDVMLLDYSKESCDQLKTRFQCVNVIEHDLCTGIPNDIEFDMCYSHMLLTMDFTNEQLMRIMRDIWNRLPSGGLMMFSVRNKGDPGFGKGRNIHDDVWENNGFAVNFFSKDDILRISEGFEILSITEFEEGELPKRLYGVILERS